MSQTVPEEAEALLTSEPLVAHLGTSQENRPHVAPLWYNYRDDTVEIVTTGRKLENIQRNPGSPCRCRRTRTADRSGA